MLVQTAIMAYSEDVEARNVQMASMMQRKHGHSDRQGAERMDGVGWVERHAPPLDRALA